MSVKINHYAQPIETNIRTCIEAGFIELFIGLICAAFAYFTYNESLVLFVSTALIAVVCFGLTLFNLYGVIDHFRSQRQQQALQNTLKSDE
ncbi:hypothetical protein [Paraglaciecola hydrolytica]|uniref:Uncharacterized protein n=1 Tax=Paraglaciecola hydrolytica TaxID=1799789 RepID=A0A136A2G3_9ALTE|nr:hypothetical protein [Paraglaciecola hydrolytica]KXI29397.1 hypothetical protein AX660_14785 [Paraglaciecola hydrolytica]